LQLRDVMDMGPSNFAYAEAVEAARIAAFGAETSVTVWRSPAGTARAGGDWCDVVPVSDEAVALTVGDVSGHGEAVAGTMATMRAAVLQSLHRIRDPSDILCVANRVAAERCEGTMVTALVAFYNHRLRTLTFSSAGHPPPLLLTPERHAFVTQQQADLPLGIFPEYASTNSVVALPSDALVVFYTDGITEHERDVIRGEAELAEAARFIYSRPKANDAQALAQHVFSRGRGLDDAAAMVLRTTPLRSLDRVRAR
jgi:serine phosphatase RsbU (regulator of sigma subunit)